MNEQNNATEITKIYLVTNCYGDPNKVYIGKTKNEISRKREHIFKYGEQALFDIIDGIKMIGNHLNVNGYNIIKI
mgnify:CR=1 FL=1